MGLRLMSLRSDREDGTVIAQLDPTSVKGNLFAKFQICEKGRISVAIPVPDVFREYAASIDEVRRITAAVLTFAEASRVNEVQEPDL